MAQSGSITISVASTLSSALDLGTASVPISYSKTISFGNGTGAAQADLVWHDARQLTTGQSEDIDLAGALTGLLGGTLTMAKLKGVVVIAEAAGQAANTTTITVSRPAAAGVSLFGAASDALAPLKAGNAFVWTDNSAAGVTVTATTADLITITNSAGASAWYTIVVFGASA